VSTDLLIDRTGSLSPDDSKTHLRFPFRLDRECANLHIEFDYSPKLLEDEERARDLLDAAFELYVEPARRAAARANAERYLPLANLVTVSVDDPNRYRGACHRQDPMQRLHLSAVEATPGLLPGRIEEGEWTLTLSVHAIVTESCSYRLKAWATGEGDE